MQRYFASRGKDGRIVIRDDDIFHFVKVARAKLGEEFELSIDGEVFLASVTSLEPFSYEIKKKETSFDELDGKLTLIMGYPKGDKLDLIVQKATEIGVVEIDVFFATRSVVKLDEKRKEARLERLAKIVKEAAGQCRRRIIPSVSFIDFNGVLHINFDIKLVAYEATKESVDSFKETLKIAKGKSVAIAIGPEGGFSKEEIADMTSYGYKEISLGGRILRCETAAIYATSLLSFFME
jgi:16S rRNA (uracil1498-N3)-methyltransferase